MFLIIIGKVLLFLLSIAFLLIPQQNPNFSLLYEYFVKNSVFKNLDGL